MYFNMFMAVQDIPKSIISVLIKGFSGPMATNWAKLGSGTKNPFMGAQTWSYIEEMFGYVRPVGIALAVTVFILNLIDLATKDNATFDNFVKLVLNIIFTIATINLASTIVDIFVDINDSLMNNLWTGDLKNTPLKDNSFFNFSFSLVEALVAIVILLIPFIIGLIADVALAFPLISRCFEVAWRCVFLPIGVCNFTGGAQSPAIRYLKNLMATMLTGAFYIVILRLLAGFSISLIDSLFDFDDISDFILVCWEMIGDVLLVVVLKFAALGVMMSGTRVMKEVIG